MPGMRTGVQGIHGNQMSELAVTITCRSAGVMNAMGSIRVHPDIPPTAKMVLGGTFLGYPDQREFLLNNTIYLFRYSGKMPQGPMENYEKKPDFCFIPESHSCRCSSAGTF